VRLSCTKSHQPFARAAALFFARIIQVRHRSHATYSRQPRQVRKEATVTGSCVCSGVPVPGLFCFGYAKLSAPRQQLDNLLAILQNTPFHTQEL